MPIAVALIEDDASTRDAFAVLLKGAPGFRFISAHATAEDALATLPLKDVDVVLVDIGLPLMSGIELTRELKRRRADLLVLMLTVHLDTDRVFGALKAGADGYLLKRTPPAQVLEAIAEVKAGGAPMTRGIARKVLQDFHQRPQPASELETLTERESEVLRELATGYTAKEIADRLGIQFNTVRSHIKTVYRKLHVTHRLAAVEKWRTRGGGH
jgi:DNA-binding NarL/FixJ family response regulator